MKAKIGFIIILSLFTQLLQAQKDTVKSNADLPVLNYPTALLKTGDTTAIHTWIKNMAVSELKHTDSILKNYAIMDPFLLVTLIRTKSLCNFITADWADLSQTDTVFKHIQQGAPAFKKGGIAELSCYAKAMQLPGNDFKKSYHDFFMKAMDSLTANEQETFISNVLSKMNVAAVRYQKDINKFKKAAFVSDTSLYDFLKSYVYGQLKEINYNELSAYINKAVKEKFTKADTLRGSITPERAWWDVLHYALTVQPDYTAKTISGKNTIRYKVISDSYPAFMQIDLKEPLVIDSIVFGTSRKLSFAKDKNVWHVAVPKQKKLSVDSVTVYYHGKVHEALTQPWDEGWFWAKDSLGNPWMSVSCEGIGASMWYPCKDHRSDEPDNGASVTMIVPDTLVAIANGRLQSKQNNNNGTATYKWAVTNPVNNYGISAYIGKYVNISKVYKGSNGNLDVNCWVLNYNVERAKAHMIPEVNRVLKAFEYWLGPYPFYKDGYQLVDAPYYGMEHQSALAYGNQYMNGARGYDLSRTGWGLKWDYVIVYESGHEWFGNNITSKDIADLWVHEGLTMYAEALFAEYYYGKKAGNEYVTGLRDRIQNVFPLTGYYGVNDDISVRNEDIYDKGGSMMQTVRHSMNDDSLFRQIIIELNKTFYHQTVTAKQVENYISQKAGFDYSKVFDQYIRNVQIPQFDFYFSNDKKKVFYRYSNCVNGFNLPLVLQDEHQKLKLIPSESWKSIQVNPSQQPLFNTDSVEKMYYLDVLETKAD